MKQMKIDLTQYTLNLIQLENFASECFGKIMETPNMSEKEIEVEFESKDNSLFFLKILETAFKKR